MNEVSTEKNQTEQRPNIRSAVSTGGVKGKRQNLKEKKKKKNGKNSKTNPTELTKCGAKPKGFLVKND